MKFKIKIEYSTGDSFGCSDEVDWLDGTWESLGIAKENLKRIKAHQEYYMAKEDERIYGGKLPPKPECYVEGNLLLLADNGKEYQIRPFWQGYFEGFYSAEIGLDESDWKISID